MKMERDKLEAMRSVMKNYNRWNGGTRGKRIGFSFMMVGLQIATLYALGACLKTPLFPFSLGHGWSQVLGQMFLFLLVFNFWKRCLRRFDPWEKERMNRPDLYSTVMAELKRDGDKPEVA
ncbi:MAG: hypothetical protein QM796_22570 [Chthoniobacteraceae bacterium]